MRDVTKIGRKGGYLSGCTVKEIECQIRSIRLAVRYGKRVIFLQGNHEDAEKFDEENIENEPKNPGVFGQDHGLIVKYNCFFGIFVIEGMGWVYDFGRPKEGSRNWTKLDKEGFKNLQKL